MTKERAFTEITYLFWGKHEKSPEEIKERTQQILEQLQTYNYNLGKRDGMFKAVNILTEEAEKEGKQ